MRSSELEEECVWRTTSSVAIATNVLMVSIFGVLVTTQEVLVVIVVHLIVVH